MVNRGGFGRVARGGLGGVGGAGMGWFCRLVAALCDGVEVMG